MHSIVLRIFFYLWIVRHCLTFPCQRGCVCPSSFLSRSACVWPFQNLKGFMLTKISFDIGNGLDDNDRMWGLYLPCDWITWCDYVEVYNLSNIEWRCCPRNWQLTNANGRCWIENINVLDIIINLPMPMEIFYNWTMSMKLLQQGHIIDLNLSNETIFYDTLSLPTETTFKCMTSQYRLITHYTEMENERANW